MADTNQIDNSGESPTALRDEGPAQVPDPLADVVPGGVLDQVLARPDRMSLDDEAKKLNDKLRADVESMRQVVKDPRIRLNRLYSETPPAQLPWHLVHGESQYYSADPVLRFCLQNRWSIEDSEGKILDAAWAAYLRQPDEYDRILGDIIPASFRSNARERVSENRFDSNYNLTAADDWPVYRARLQTRRVKKLLGVSTGLPALDAALRGLRGLTYLGGGPGVGKTTLALFMAACALHKHPNLAVLFYSMDMPKSVLYDRLLCMETGIAYADLVAELNTDKKQKVEDADARLRAEVLPRLRIVERIVPAKNESVAMAIQNDIDQLKTVAMGVLTIVDYFQLLPITGKIDTSIDADFDRVRSLQQVQEWSRTNMYPEGNPMLVISEVRKGESGRNELSTTDLMGSARLGFSAETVLLLEPPNKDTPGDVVPVRLNIAKARDGAVRSKIDLLFEHTRYRFREAPPRQARKQNKPVTGDPAKKKPDQGMIDPLAGLEEE